MTTDITELAQREKFEAWFVNDVVGADVNFPAFKDGEYAEGEIYDEQLYFMLQAMWMAWKAAGAELVEALEKAQARSSKWLEAYHKAVSVGARYEERIAELESRTVKLPKPISVLHRREFTEAHCAIYAYPEAEVNAALDDSGIKWEAE